MIGHCDGAVLRNEILFGHALHILRGYLIDIVNRGEQLAPVTIIDIIKSQKLSQAVDNLANSLAQIGGKVVAQ